MSALEPVPISLLPEMWPLIDKYIVSALRFADGKYSNGDVFRRCLTGDLVLWVVYNKNQQFKGCFLTEILEYPQSRRLGIFLLGGDDFEDIICHLERFKKWAIANKADSIECYGRPGWEKMLSPHGFQKTHTVMRLHL